MADVFLPSVVSRYKLAMATNSTATSFSALIPTITKPAASATRAVFDMGKEGLRDLNTLVVMPFGGNTNNDIINVKVLKWIRVPRTTPVMGAPDMYVAEVVCEVQATLSSSLPGLADEEVVVAEFLADTLTLTKGVAVLFNGTADIDPAYFKCDISGAEIVELVFDLGTGGDTQNALVRFDA